MLKHCNSPSVSNLHQRSLAPRFYDSPSSSACSFSLSSSSSSSASDEDDALEAVASRESPSSATSIDYVRQRVAEHGRHHFTTATPLSTVVVVGDGNWQKQHLQSRSGRLLLPTVFEQAAAVKRHELLHVKPVGAVYNAPQLHDKCQECPIKIYANCLRSDIEYKTVSVGYHTTCAQLIRLLLAKCKMSHRDPNLFYLTMEIDSDGTSAEAIASPTTPQKQILPSAADVIGGGIGRAVRSLVLDDESKPVQIERCRPWDGRACRFVLRMHRGGALIRFHDGALRRGSCYKSVYLAESTTAAEAVAMVAGAASRGGSGNVADGGVAAHCVYEQRIVKTRVTSSMLPLAYSSCRVSATKATAVQQPLLQPISDVETVQSERRLRDDECPVRVLAAFNRTQRHSKTTTATASLSNSAASRRTRRCSGVAGSDGDNRDDATTTTTVELRFVIRPRRLAPQGSPVVKRCESNVSLTESSDSGIKMSPTPPPQSSSTSATTSEVIYEEIVEQRRNVRVADEVEQLTRPRHLYQQRRRQQRQCHVSASTSALHNLPVPQLLPLSSMSLAVRATSPAMATSKCRCPCHPPVVHSDSNDAICQPIYTNVANSPRRSTLGCVAARRSRLSLATTASGLHEPQRHEVHHARLFRSGGGSSGNGNRPCSRHSLSQLDEYGGSGRFCAHEEDSVSTFHYYV